MQKGLFAGGSIYPAVLSLFYTFVFIILIAWSTLCTAQGFPSGITSATLSMQLPDSTLGSPNSANTVTIKASSISNISKAHLSVVNVSDSVLFSQVYDVKRSSVYNISGGYSISLRFFTQINIGAHTIKVRLEDNNENLGTAFTVVQ